MAKRTSFAASPTKPKVVFDDGTVGHVVQPGPEVSLIYLPDEQREQFYPNNLFRPFQMKIRAKRHLMRVRTRRPKVQ